MRWLRELRDRLICRQRGHRGPYLFEYDGTGGDSCVRCKQPLWEVTT